MEYCVFIEPQQGADYDTQLAFAQTAERLGFDGFFRSDHFLKMGDFFDGLPGPTDALTTIAGLARETSRIRLGTLVSSVTYRHPGLLAIQAAQIDAMSGGRFELGLGTGWYEAEHRAYGLPFPAKRFDLLEEQLQILTGLWSTPIGETFSFAGAHYRLEDAPALPKPVQSPMPLIVGGAGPSRTPALAASYATEFNIVFQPEDVIADRLERVVRACEAIDRDPATLKRTVGLTVLAGASEADVARRAANTGVDLAAFRESHTFCGSADAIAERVGRLRERGAERIYFQMIDMTDLDHLAYLGEEVLPILPR
ncbi:LLM class F420-dependent oxidoreductase [Microbacterium sediminis]|uniref:LLM class F420-dependent oxidoreductase n=1 Tax=Microbacterium sediminis TaxID=904291 RepID=A0A1B9NI12_9MICO|nr:LLM class F420-dependent oxidoreductase [Microbacterium sediminis]OCG76216.1 LLM class F420-dependent oxidoreductase [Microbacterium sediminis]QBR73420.1 LLM class F420-dependent oxidoreductase [Microbacterium sediminis]